MVSPDSTYFSGITSDVSEHLTNGLWLQFWLSAEPKSAPSIKLFTIASTEGLHLRSHSDSVFVAAERMTSCVDTTTHTKCRFASETTASILKAAELHQNLLNLRLSMNLLYTERFQLQKELDGILMRRENLLAEHQDLQSAQSSTIAKSEALDFTWVQVVRELAQLCRPPNMQRLLELRKSLVQESERTARLLDAAIQAKHSVLDPDSLEAINNLVREHRKERQNIANRQLKALEEQIDLLKQYEDSVTAAMAENALHLVSDVNAERTVERENLALHSWPRICHNLIIITPTELNQVAQPLNEALPIQNASLQHSRTGKNRSKSVHLQQRLLESKNRLRTFLSAELSRKAALLEEKTGIKLPEVEVPSTNEANRKIRLKILRFGLEERRKKLQHYENTAATLAAKLDFMKQEAHKKSVSLLADLLTSIEVQQKSYREFRHQVERMRRELDETKVSSEESTEVTIEERNQKLGALTAKISAIKAEICQLNAQPALAYQQLDATKKEMESAISEAKQTCTRIKSKIRKRYKMLKSLRPMEVEVSARLQKLDDLNHRFSAVSKRLEFAENLNRKTQEALARQELRVEDAKLKFNRVKELYAEEKRAQLGRMRELEMEKEEYMEKLMCLNRKLDRLGRQKLFKGVQGAYKWLMASFDVQEPEEEEEIDEFVGKRCTIFCQEIKRLQQHSAWLEENLKAVQSKSLSRQRISAIKAVLDRGGPQTTSTNVTKRSLNRSTRPRPISVIETGTKSIARPITPGPLTVPSHIESRRRMMGFGNPTPSQGAPAVSATQRRLAYSQSLREKHKTSKTSLASHSFQRETPTSASLSFRTTIPLIYTAFRSTKCTVSRTFDGAI
ncbi:hypothetical protein EGR_06989 [Echinococcus granulosus]|uniref:Uncharacterized protein n=1 Tax=Echinococcus granulosus TaxID=6210 RepID=W6UXB1_ECHGR|nr:hypothetical protein EGR_06989 [Echinococcus granulosus]EUB58159.1 hypothetical protein EGR_06989 [Echinococcus granulosus]